MLQASTQPKNTPLRKGKDKLSKSTDHRGEGNEEKGRRTETNGEKLREFTDVISKSNSKRRERGTGLQKGQADKEAD